MFFRAGTVSLWLAVVAASAATAEPSHLWEILQTQVGGGRSFQADVEYISAPGADMGRNKEDRLRLLDYMKSHGQQVSAWSEELARSAVVDYAPEKSFYRYYRLMPDKIRIEAFGKAKDGLELQRAFLEASVFTGDRWEMFTPTPPKEKDGVKWQNDLFVRMQPPAPPVLEIARCGAGHFLGLFAGQATSLSSLSKATDQVSWPDLFKVLAPETAVDLMEPLPSGGPPLPLLQVGDRPIAKFPLGGVRLRVWFSPADGYLPVRMECMGLAGGETEGKQYFLPDMIAEWGDAVALPNGQRFARQAIIRVYATSSPVVEGKDMGQWPTVAYNMHIFTVKFSNVRVNEPIDPALFKIVPPPGTNVVDQISHETYIVGSSGEELRKMALDTEVDRLPKPSPYRMWLVLLGLGVPAAVLAAGLVLWRRRAARQRRTSE